MPLCYECVFVCLFEERERVCTAFSGHSPGTKADCEETGKKNHVTLACFKNNTEEQKIILLTLLCEYRLEKLCFIYDQTSKLQKDVQITKVFSRCFTRVLRISLMT